MMAYLIVHFELLGLARHYCAYQHMTTGSCSCVDYYTDTNKYLINVPCDMASHTVAQLVYDTIDKNLEDFIYCLPFTTLSHLFPVSLPVPQKRGNILFSITVVFKVYYHS